MFGSPAQAARCGGASSTPRRSIPRFTLIDREKEQMTLSTIQPFANRRDVARTIFRYGPSTAALFYPLLLVSLHQSGRQFVQATDATGKVLAGLAVGLSAALVYTVPLLSFAAISQSAGQIRTRQFAHLAFAAPPLFVMIGVFFYMLNVPNGDYAFWAIAWLGVIGFAAFVSPTNEMPAAAPRWLRPATDFPPARLLRSSWRGTSPIT